MPKRKELRIGVIAAGGRGHLAHHAHKPEEGVRLAAGADIDEKALEDFSKRFGPDAFVTKDYRELLARGDIDAVFVCSPDFLHEEHAVAALEAGKAVYLEKPMAITIAGCDRILKTAYRNKVKLYLGHNMRHMFFVLKMKQLIDKGEIGQVRAAWCRHFVGYGGDFYFKDWHADRTKSTGLLLQKAAHDIDVLHWLCGGYTTRVSAMGGLTVYGQIKNREKESRFGKRDWSTANWPPLSLEGLNPVVDVEDISMMNMQLDNGVFASYQQCHFCPDYWRNYTFIGTEGRIENFGDGQEDSFIRLWNKRTTYNANGDAMFFTPPTEGSHGGADPLIVREFVRFVREGGRTNTSPIAARNSVAAGYMATMSLRQGGQPMDVPPLDPALIRHFDKQAMKEEG